MLSEERRACVMRKCAEFTTTMSRASVLPGVASTEQRTSPGYTAKPGTVGLSALSSLPTTTKNIPPALPPTAGPGTRRFYASRV